MYFICSVVLIKLVDGVWFYGLLLYYGEECLWLLLEIFFEEFGDGVLVCNYVLFYWCLLVSIGSEEVEGFSDFYYLQGIQ